MIKNKLNLLNVLLVVVIILGFWLRLYRLDSLPIEMHRDEASIAYNAFSFLKTGLGEHNEGPWPKIFISFGDYKLPGLVYLTAISFKFLGVSVWSSRILTTLLASLLLIVIYFLATELFQDKRKATLASILLSFSFWHVFLARTIYEPMAALTVSSLTILFILKARKKISYLYLAALLFLISNLIYNLPFLLLLPLFLGILWIYRRNFLAQPKRHLILGCVLFLLAAILSRNLTSSLISGKLQTTILAAPEIQTQIDHYQSQLILSGVHHRIAKLFINRYTVGGQSFLRGYALTYNPGFLFFNGGNNPWHSLGTLDIGNLNPALIPLIILGIWQLARSSQKETRFLWFYFLVSPIPSALTVDAPVTNRLLDFHLVLVLIAALGLDWILKQSKSQLVKGSLLFGLGIYCFFFLNFWLRYTQLHQKNLSDHWPEGIRQTIFHLNQIKDQYPQIYLDFNQTPQHQFAYIFFLFYLQYDPTTLHTQAVWNNDLVYLRSSQFPPFTVLDLPNLDSMSNQDLLKLIPQEGEKVLIVERLTPESDVNKRAIFTLNDSLGHPNWQMIEIDKQEILKKLKE